MDWGNDVGGPKNQFLDRQMTVKGVGMDKKPDKIAIWLLVWNIFYFSILGIIIPTDFHIFQRGRSTTNQL